MSGLSASEDLNSAEEQGNSAVELAREEFEDGNDMLLHDAEQDDADLYEDAEPGQQQQQEEEDEGLGRSEDQEEIGVPPVRVRAPLSDETEELDAPGEEDGQGSFGSGESFDSALERMAASSNASYDTGSSPRVFSPVGSLSGPAVLGNPPSVMNVSQQGALMRLNEMLTGEPSLDTFIIDNSSVEEFKHRIAQLADSRGQSVDDASFGSIEDALLPLVLEKSEKYKPGLQVAEVEDDNNEVEAIRVTDQDSRESQSPMPKAKLSADDEAHLTDDDKPEESQEHDLENGAVENDNENGDDRVDDSVSEKVEEKEGSERKIQQESLQEEAAIPDSEEAPNAVVDSVPEMNGGKDEVVDSVPETNGGKDEGLEAARTGEAEEQPGVQTEDATLQYGSGDEADLKDEEEQPRVLAMPKAKLTADDEGGSEEHEDSEERDDDGDVGDDELSGDEHSEGDSEENHAEEDVQDVPFKIRATLSDLDDSVTLPHSEYKEENGLHEDNLDDMDEEVLPKVRAPVSEPDLDIHVEAPRTDTPENLETRDLGTGETVSPQDSPEAPEEAQGRPIAKLSEYDTESPVGDDDRTDVVGEDTVQEVPRDENFVSPELVAENIGGGEFVGTETPEVVSENFPGHESADAEAPGKNSDKESNEIAGDVVQAAEPCEIPSDLKAENLDAETVPEHESAETDAPGKVSDKESNEIPGEVIQAPEPFQNPSDPKVESLDETVAEIAHKNEEVDATAYSNGGSEEDDEDNGVAAMERSSAFAALVRAADSPAGVEGGIPSLGSAGPSLPARPTRTVRSSVPSQDSVPRVVQQPRSSGATPAQLSSSPDDTLANAEVPDGNEEIREKLQGIRVKFLRLALRLGQSSHNVVVAQVLYRLGLAEQLRGGRSNSRSGAFSFDRASVIAEQQETAGREELDFTCTIMLLGKTGVGKSATVNSIFDEPKTGTNAFSPSTKKVQVITGHVHGIKVRVIDTPGLLPSVADQRHNEKVMASVKGFIKKQSPDIVLYFDRLDMQSRDYGDVPLLRTITDTFGAAVWFNAIVVLTHASSAPPDGPNGLPLSYEMFLAQRSHIVQQTIRQAAGDMRLMNPVSLVENHPACRVNRSGQRVLPNGQVWKPQLLLLCFASKILAEANTLLRLQESTPGRAFGARPRVPPLPFLLSSLLQSRAQLKLPDEQVGDEDESDEELDEDADSDEEEDYDQLPPFRRLSKEEVAELDEDNRSKYFEELAERERLFQKKQWKEELKRRRELKRRMAEGTGDISQPLDEGLEDDMTRSAAVPVPIPDMVLPPSFDSDNPSHRYRYLETANQWLVRPVLETHGWDHDNGYDGMSVEKMFIIGEKIPASISGQITKDKKEASVNMECVASLKHGEGKVTLAGLDMQTVGKDLAYTLRGETRFSNFKGNKTTGGLALTLFGDTIAAGMKIEDRLILGKRLKLVLNGGAITGRGDVAYGGSLEATLRDKDYPLSRTLSTLGVSVMDWHGDLAIGGNLQSQMVLGKTMMVGRANLNNRGAGQISIRASSSEQLQMALIGLLPIIRSLANRLFGSESQR